MSFFPATIPASPRLHHGMHMRDSLKSMELLSLKIKHTKILTQSFRGRHRFPWSSRPSGEGPGGGLPDDGSKRLAPPSSKMQIFIPLSHCQMNRASFRPTVSIPIEQKPTFYWPTSSATTKPISKLQEASAPQIT